MAIRVSCASCKAEVHVDDTLAGKDIICPSCRERMTVPSLAAGQPEARASGSEEYEEDDRGRRAEGRGAGGLPRWDDREDYDLPRRHDTTRWNATVTGLNLIFWTSVAILVLFLIMQVIGLAMGNNPQMFAAGGGGQPPPQAMAFGLGMMAMGCIMIVLFIIWFVGMCMCCTVPAESGAKGRAITTVVLIGVSVVVGIILVVGLGVYTVGQAQRMGGPPPPGQMPFPVGAMLTVFIIAALDSALLVTLWMMFHKAIAGYFHNDRLARHCVWYLIFYFVTAVVTWTLNIAGNPMFHGGNLLQPPSTLMIMAQIWGLVVMLAASAWYLYINRETRRTILEDQPASEGGDPMDHEGG